MLTADAMALIRSLSTTVAMAIVACSSSPRNVTDTLPPEVPPPGPYSGEIDMSAEAGVASHGGLAKVPVGTSPVRGPSDAWVTMVEFGDFECPFCGQEEPVLAALLAKYPSDLRLVFKNYPLTDIHAFAQGAAIAAVCAGEQGAFWPMHDVLFANQGALESVNLPTYAQSAGLDVPTWQACLSTQPPLDAVAADVALGDSIGIKGTPTFVINGLSILGAYELPDMEAMVDEAKASAQASGVPSSQYYDTVILGQ